MPDSLPLGPAFSKALGYATHLHGAHVRKGSGIPYVSHLLSVCALVLEDGGAETEAIAALLHDAAEDHGGEKRLDEIRREFGDDVADIVAHLSDSLAADPGEKAPWDERKREYLLRLTDVSDPAVLRVSCADKLHNARTLLADLDTEGAAVWTRFNAPPDKQLWYYDELAKIFEAKRVGRMAAELRRTIDDLAELHLRATS